MDARMRGQEEKARSVSPSCKVTEAVFIICLIDNDEDNDTDTDNDKSSMAGISVVQTLEALEVPRSISRDIISIL